MLITESVVIVGGEMKPPPACLLVLDKVQSL